MIPPGRDRLSPSCQHTQPRRAPAGRDAASRPPTGPDPTPRASPAASSRQRGGRTPSQSVTGRICHRCPGPAAMRAHRGRMALGQTPNWVICPVGLCRGLLSVVAENRGWPGDISASCGLCVRWLSTSGHGAQGARSVASRGDRGRSRPVLACCCIAVWRSPHRNDLIAYWGSWWRPSSPSRRAGCPGPGAHGLRRRSARLTKRPSTVLPMYWPGRSGAVDAAAAERGLLAPEPIPVRWQGRRWRCRPAAAAAAAAVRAAARDDRCHRGSSWRRARYQGSARGVRGWGRGGW